MGGIVCSSHHVLDSHDQLVLHTAQPIARAFLHAAVIEESFDPFNEEEVQNFLINSLNNSLLIPTQRNKHRQ